MKNHLIFTHFKKRVSAGNAGRFHQLRIGVYFGHSCSALFFYAAVFEMDRFQVAAFRSSSFGME